MENLSKTSSIILDSVLNIRNVSNPENVFETIIIIHQKEREELQEEWNNLVHQNIIIEKDYQWAINPLYKDEITKQLEEYYKNEDITQEYTMTLLENCIKKEPIKLSFLIKVLGRVIEQEQSAYVGFSDYDMNNEIRFLCEELVKQNIMFRVSLSSRKHYYRNFYIRMQPFDTSKIIRDIVLKYLNIEGLTSEEWKVLSLLLLSPYLTLKYDIIKNNTDFTKPELREIVTNLENKGLIKEEYPDISLVKNLREPLNQYFKTNIYPQIRSDATNQLKQRISRSLSNLTTFMNAKSIYELPGGETRLEPFLHKYMNKREISGHEPFLPDMQSLGLIWDFDDRIIVLADTVKDIENWLKGSIKESLIVIPARDLFMARRVLQKIFFECKDYIKIQDPYVGEETFYIFEYIPKNIKINLLTGIELGRNEDPDMIYQCIKRLRDERRGSFQILFMGDSGGSPPFHDRFIISRNRCWQIGTSLKQIGKGKDTTVSEISEREKDEMIEPSFDRWWNSRKKELEERNLMKINEDDWKTHIGGFS